MRMFSETGGSAYPAALRDRNRRVIPFGGLYHVNAQNHIATVNSQSGVVTYDANGNLLTDPSGWAYTCDAWNRQVSVARGSTDAGRIRTLRESVPR